MPDEKKEEQAAKPAQEAPKVTEAPKAAAPQEVKAPAQETPAAAQETQAPAQTQAKPAEEKKAKAERPSNCAGCNKSIKKKRWYYRNGKFYCTKRCWQAALKKEKKAETPGAEGQPAKT